MCVVRKSLVAVGVLLAVFWVARSSCSSAGPQAAAPRTVAPAPARADLAEAVYAMVAARAAEAGLPQPVTLCQACVAAHLGLPNAAVRQRCRQACGLADRVPNEQQ